MARKTAKDRREALRQRQRQATADRDKKGLGSGGVLDWSKMEGTVNHLQVKSGRDKNLIDIIPFEITEEWYAKLRSFSGRPTGLQPGDWDYKLEVPVHRNIGEDNASFICLRLAFGKKCPICEDMFAEYEKEDRDEKRIRALTPSWRCFYNVYDYDNPDQEIHIWSNVSYHLFEKYLLEAAQLPGEDLDIVTFSDLEDGRSIEFRMREKSLGKNKFLEAEGIEFITRDAYEEEIVQDTVGFDALAVIATYDEMSRAHLNIGVDSEESSEPESSETEQKDEPPAERTRTRRKPPAKEEKEPVKTTRTRKKVEPEPEPEPEPEKETVDESECPKGGTFGKDCNELEDCIDCPEETFAACADEQEKLKEEKKEKPKRVPRGRK